MNKTKYKSPNFENAEVNAAVDNFTPKKSNRVPPEIKMADVILETLVARLADLV